MLAWILIVIIALFLLYDVDITGERVKVHGFTTKYFYMSHGESKNVFEKMKKDGLPDETIKEFIMTIIDL